MTEFAEKSKALFEEALKLFPGGVNSPVRAAVKPYPFYVERAEGAELITIDGDRLIDYVLGYGPLILGHKHPEVLKAVIEQLEKGWLYGTPSKSEVELAKKITKYYHADMVRFVNSGTEATVTAIRLARGFTNRSYIVKFEGCYHGSNDSLLVKAGSAATHYGVPSSRGIPDELTRLTYVLPYNDVEAFEKFMRSHGESIAAVIVEPIIANSGLILPDVEFLKALREYTKSYGALLIFDEVVTGFRVALGGVQELYNIKADLTTLGKIVGGGFPIGVVVGPKEIMENLTPLGKVFNAGTFNAHPVAMAAGLATIGVLERDRSVYETANSAAKTLAETLLTQAEKCGIDATVNTIASMVQIFFTKGPVKNYNDAKASNTKLYVKLHTELLKRKVFIPPSQFETWFTSSAHTSSIVEKTINAIEEAIPKLL